MFDFGEGIASEKHVVQTVNQSAQTAKRLTERSNKTADSLFKRVFCSFSFDIVTQNSKLTATAAARKFILTLGAWINHNTSHHLIYPGQSRMEAKPFEWFGVNIWPVEHQLIGKHHVASSRSAQPAQPTPGWSQVVATRDCKASCGLDFTGFLQKVRMCSAVLQSIQKPPINYEGKLFLFSFSLKCVLFDYHTPCIRKAQHTLYGRVFMLSTYFQNLIEGSTACLPGQWMYMYTYIIMCTQNWLEYIPSINGWSCLNDKCYLNTNIYTVNTPKNVWFTIAIFAIDELREREREREREYFITFLK